MAQKKKPAPKRRAPECVALPLGFRRYPTEGGPLHGTIEVDLGTWLARGKVRRFHLRIHASGLPKLVEVVLADKHHQRKFGKGALDVFSVAEEPLPWEK